MISVNVVVYNAPEYGPGGGVPERGDSMRRVVGILMCAAASFYLMTGLQAIAEHPSWAYGFLEAPPPPAPAGRGGRGRGAAAADGRGGAAAADGRGGAAAADGRGGAAAPEGGRGG